MMFGFVSVQPLHMGLKTAEVAKLLEIFAIKDGL